MALWICLRVDGPVVDPCRDLRACEGTNHAPIAPVTSRPGPVSTPAAAPSPKNHSGARPPADGAGAEVHHLQVGYRVVVLRTQALCCTMGLHRIVCVEREPAHAKCAASADASGHNAHAVVHVDRLTCGFLDARRHTFVRSLDPQSFDHIGRHARIGVEQLWQVAMPIRLLAPAIAKAPVMLGSVRRFARRSRARRA